MQYFAIQVKTTEEDDFIRHATAKPAPPTGRFFAPKRLMEQRRGGKNFKRLLPVFPGYVFYETEELSPDDRWSIRRTEGFFRFLKTSLNPTPLSDSDKSVLLHFISFGKFADISKVTFDENDRIVVLEGPLKGLEGKIVRVDRRRGRAKIALDMCASAFLIDLGFAVVEKVPKGGDDSHDDRRA